MRKVLGLLLPLAALAAVADAFAFQGVARAPLLRSRLPARREESSLHPATRRGPVGRMATTMMAAGGKKKKVLVLGGDGCVHRVAGL